MKNFKDFGDFVNENYLITEVGPGRGRPLDAIAAAIITSKDFDKQDLYYYRDNFKRDLENIGINDSITAAKLVKHPRFDELESRWKDLIYKKVGTGKKSTYSEFIKTFVAAMQHFPDLYDFKFGYRYLGSDLDLLEILRFAISLRNDLEKGNYPSSYYGIDPAHKKQLKAVMSGYEIKDKLSPEELQFLQKVVKPKYESFIKSKLTDEFINKVISREWYIVYTPENKHDDTAQFLKGINLIKDMPDLFEFIKEALLNEKIKTSDWETLSAKCKMTYSKHSAVVSSSFSTTYYYDVDVTFMGKHFSAKNVALSSSYYSGGWN